MKKFSDQVAIVTGGSRGIGLAIAESLAYEGAKIALFDINEEGLIIAEEFLNSKGYVVNTYKVDVSVSEEVENAIDNVVQDLGKIDILINNAGITRDNFLFKMNENDWDSVISVHLKGAFNMCRGVQAYMVPNKYGRIVNLSSTSALGNKGQANYATAKAGLQGLTKTLAIELGKFGITTNAVAPGFIETDMTKATAERMGLTFEEYSELLIKDIPVQRSGKPQDIANAVVFLADPANSYVNGQVLYVSGGP